MPKKRSGYLNGVSEKAAPEQPETKPQPRTRMSAPKPPPASPKPPPAPPKPKAAGNASRLPPLEQLPADQEAPPLEGSTWEVTMQFTDKTQPYLYRFLSGGVLDYETTYGHWKNGTWRQKGAAIYIEKNQRYAEYHGVIRGEQINGWAQNITNTNWTWSANRVSEEEAKSKHLYEGE